MDDHLDDSDTSDWPTFTSREAALLAETVAMAASAALGFPCVARFDPQTAAFDVRLAAAVAPEYLH